MAEDIITETTWESLPELDREILADASDDRYSLWETVFTVRSHFSGGTDAELIPVAQARLRSLAQQGLIELVRVHPDGSEAKVPPEAREEILGDAALFAASPQAPSGVAYRASEQGWHLCYPATSAERLEAWRVGVEEHRPTADTPLDKQ